MDILTTSEEFVRNVVALFRQQSHVFCWDQPRDAIPD